jgi:hypothetical protein
MVDSAERQFGADVNILVTVIGRIRVLYERRGIRGSKVGLNASRGCLIVRLISMI